MKPDSCFARPIGVRVLALLALLISASASWAAANVLIIRGAPAPEIPFADSTRDNVEDNLRRQLQFVDDQTTVSVTFGVPPSLAGFDAVWDIDFVHPIATTTRDQYLAYLASGKTLYLIGENNAFPTFEGRNNSLLAFFSAAGGGNLTFRQHTGDDLPNVDGPQTVEAVQPPFNGPNPLSTITYALPGSVTSAGNGQVISLRTDPAGNTASAIAFSRLVVVFDANVLEGFRFPAQDLPFVRNLIAYAAVPGLAGIIEGAGRPYSVAIHGGFAYFADPGSHTVWKAPLSGGPRVPVAGIGWKTDVDPQDRQGYNGDGIEATEAQLDNPSGVALDADGNLFIADSGNHVIRRIGAGASFITTAAGIPMSFAVGENIRLFSPRAVAVDQAGNVYFSDLMNQQVKRLDKATGAVSVVAGVAGRPGDNDGPAAGAEFCPLGGDCPPLAARLNSPMGLAVDSAGNVSLADEGNNRIRMISAAGVVSTLPVSGLLKPTGVAVTPDGGTVYIADYGNHRVLRATNCAVTCTVTTVAGTGEPGLGSPSPGTPGTAIQLNSPMAVTLQDNLLHIADMVNGRIVTINLTPAP